MMLLCILITLVVLAVSINLSEKIYYPRRSNKVNNKPSYAKPSYFRTHNKQYYKSFVYNNFLLGHFMNHLKNKEEEKRSKVENGQKCKKKNNRVFHLPKN